MLVIVGLIIAFILVAIYSRRETRACRWREYRQPGGDPPTHWRCAACGAEIVTHDGVKPKDCYARGAGKGPGQ